MTEYYSIFLVLVFVLGSVVFVIGAYLLARHFLSAQIDEHTKDLASSVIFRISALHGLILALVFAQELLNYNAVKNTVTKEAVAVGNVFFDLGRFEQSETLEIRKSLSSYVHSVVHEEWSRLAQGQGLSPASWKHWETAFQGILDLEAETPRKKILLDYVHTNIRLVSGFRRNRENAATSGANPLFWAVAVVGLLLIAIPYFTFPPTRLNLVMLTVFGAYTGLVMFAIAAVANPYNHPAKLYPVELESLFRSEMANFHTGK